MGAWRSGGSREPNSSMLRVLRVVSRLALLLQNHASALISRSPARRVILGVDFTSAPGPRKAISVARAALTGNQLEVTAIDQLTSFADFESLLRTPGPWVGGFDFPFGLPRELVVTLGWPQEWSHLVSHIQSIGKEAFKDALNSVRESRPMGSRYIARRGDAAAGSSSPMKLVNPPVGLMFFEGVPRLLAAGVCVHPCAPSQDSRIALEAYPGYLARQITRASYKKDGKEGARPDRCEARVEIVEAMTSGHASVAPIELVLPTALKNACVDDGSGDCLDAVICAVQAAIAGVCSAAAGDKYGIPTYADPLEGWIVTVSASC